MRTRVLIFCALFLTSALASADPPSPSSHDVYVDTGWTGTAIGADPDGSGPAAHFGTDAFATIDDGLGAVAMNGTVHVAGGIYTEQLEIDHDLTLKGAGPTTIIQSPNLLTKGFSTGVNNRPVIWVHDAGDAHILDLAVDGLSQGNANARFLGIAYQNAGGSIDHVEIKNIKNTPLDGGQHGIGIYVRNLNPAPRSITISHCNIHDYQKNGMAIVGSHLTADIAYNTVSGIGPTPEIAQNGIQLSFGAEGTIHHNHILQNQCAHPTAGCLEDPSLSPTADSAAGILIYHPGNSQIDVSHNTLEENQCSICSVGSPLLSISDNDIMENGGIGVAIFDQDQWSSAFGYDGVDTIGSVTGNTIVSHRYGIMVYDSEPGGTAPDIQAHFNRLVGNTQSAAWANASLHAENNWWGCNEGPSSPDCDTVNSSVIASPWLILRLSSDRSSLPPSESATITADLRHNSEDEDLSSSFSFTGSLGFSFASEDGQFDFSQADSRQGAVTLSYEAPSTSGPTQLSASLDHARVSYELNVEDVPEPNFDPGATMESDRPQTGEETQTDSPEGGSVSQDSPMGLPAGEPGPPPEESHEDPIEDPIVHATSGGCQLLFSF